ncbi:GDSL-type esterase/lipase family protein [Nocardioides yefusunii]|uniref:GDSL-type esterase/lipase family protein n=1 Tax=Nocardioides yefusunii TaxID=2500546 RepID=A0ABW1QXX1_9ACTN|nr:GDSL-type esterase/lipase family protein [Nocardioides yefusunii]
MKSGKRLLAFLCASALTLALAGCSGSEAEKPTPEAVDPMRVFLEPWYQDLDSHAEESATVLVVGDSISEGSMTNVDVLTARWQASLQRQLRTSVGIDGAVGFVPPYWGDVMSTEATLQSGVPSEERRFGPWGLGGRALIMPGGASITYPPLTANRIRVGYGISNFGGGQAKVHIDGFDVTAQGTLGGLQDEIPGTTPSGTPDEDEPRASDDPTEVGPTIFGASATASQAGLWWTSPELGPGPHTVRVDSIAQRFGFVHTGVEYVSSPLDPVTGEERNVGVHVLDASQAGATAAEFASKNAEAGTWTEARARDADLVLVNLGSNEEEKYEESLKIVVDRALEAAPEALVLVVDGYEPGTWEHEDWEKVRAARRNVVDQYDEGVALFDLAAQWPELAKDGSTSQGLMAEVPPLHLTPQGQQRMADIFTEWLTR